MPSSSGGTICAGQIKASNKFMSTVTKNSIISPGFQLVGKNGKPLKNLSSPISPGYQQIIDNPPSLNITNVSNTALNYKNISPQADNSSGSMIIDPNDNDNSLSNEIVWDRESPTDNTAPLLSSTKYDNTSNNNKYVNIPQQSFSSDYIRPVIVLIESSDENTNLGNWHPIKAAKFFSNNFSSVVNIKPAGSKQIKITFDTITNGNLCLNSNILKENNYNACIPSTLIFS